MHKHRDLLQNKAEQAYLCTHLQYLQEFLQLQQKNLQNHQQQIGYPMKQNGNISSETLIIMPYHDQIEWILKKKF